MSASVSVLGSLAFNKINAAKMEFQVEGIDQELPKLI